MINMINNIVEKNVSFFDPQIIPYPEKFVLSSDFITKQWMTPGLYFAQKITNNQLVRFIGEKFQVDYLQIIIVIDNDPDELLNEIFSIEQEMYKEFEWIRFDVRVRVIDKEEDINIIRKSTLSRYNRI